MKKVFSGKKETLVDEVKFWMMEKLDQYAWQEVIIEVIEN